MYKKNFLEEKEQQNNLVTRSIGAVSHAPARTRQTQPISMPHRTGITSIGTVPTMSGSIASIVTSTRSKKKNTKKDKKPKIRKEDISNPTNFQSVNSFSFHISFY